MKLIIDVERHYIRSLDFALEMHCNKRKIKIDISLALFSKKSRFITLFKFKYLFRTQ